MKLYLHIGLAKTGTSYIQSVLACSEASLANINITYPYHPSFDAARAGKITSGNITGPEKLKQIDSLISDSKPQFHSAAFSSEALYPEILNNLSFFKDLCNKFDVHVLIFLRDPIEHAMSIYIQKVKRQGFFGSVGSFFSVYNTPASVLKLIQAVENVCTVHMYNYSRCREDLLSVISSYLGVSTSAFSIPEPRVVNRSLSMPEIALQRLFNQHFGKASHRFVSDVLCNSFPEPCADEPKPLPSYKDAQDLLKRVAPSILALNAYLQDDQKLNLALSSKTEEPDSSTIALSKAKIDSIISEMASILHVPK